MYHDDHEDDGGGAGGENDSYNGQEAEKDDFFSRMLTDIDMYADLCMHV